jgi:tRNA 2-thiouridine synthesizing protein E
MNFAVNAEGYLLDSNTWEKNFTIRVAQSLALDLNEKHWIILIALRSFYESYALIPPMRVFLQYLKKNDISLMGSAEIQLLFPDPFMRHACLLAGLPKPKKCL